MKFFALFAALLSVAACYPATWTLNELSAALQNPSTDPALIPYLENALNELMASLHAGEQMESIAVAVPADLVPVAPAFETSTWTLQELSAALQNPSTNPALIPYLEDALNKLMASLFAGEQVEAIAVALPVGVPVTPAMETSTWTLAELSAALQDPATNPALVPYLEAALNQLMDSLHAGSQMDTIVVAVPAGLVPVAPAMETSTWTLAELSAALQDPATNPALVPYLEAALNQLMDSLHAGSQMDTIVVAVPAGLVPVAPAMETSTWTLAELSAALQDPTTNPALVPYLEAALNQLMDSLHAGSQMDTIVVAVPAGLVPVNPAFDTSVWTLSDLTAALASPNTNPELIPYLEAALNEIMAALYAGEQMEAIVVAVPAGMPVVVESPVTPIEVAPAPVPAPIEVAPTEVAPVSPVPESPAGSPLVQIIINIITDEQQVPAGVSPSPAVIESSPEPVHVVEQPIDPVLVVEQPIEPVHVVEAPVEVVQQNPIDVIAVGAPEVNPVDILHPVVPGVAGGVVVGPIV